VIGLGLGSQPTTEHGIFGSYQCLSLDGNSDYVLIPDSFIIGEAKKFNPESGTVSVWINIVDNDASANQNIFRFADDNTNNGVTLQYHKTNTEFRAVYRLGNVYKEATYNDAGLTHSEYMALGWIHFTVTWISDGAGTGEVKIYYNGALQETVSQPNNWGSDDIDIAVIGSNDDQSAAFADGNIDQFAVFDTVKEATEIQAIYNGGVMADLTTGYYSGASRTSYTTEGLVLYYQFEGNVLDSSGNNYTGSLNGTAGFSTSQP